MASRGHKDRLSAIDASFLHEEREASHMHVGAVVLLEGPAPSREELTEHIQSRLGLVPRYRQKLSFPRFEMGRPFWIDDPRFNIDYHVRQTALPSPGSLEQLRGLAGRIFSQRLDRSKPLWEIWLEPAHRGRPCPDHSRRRGLIHRARLRLRWRLPHPSGTSCPRTRALHGQPGRRRCG